MNNKPSSRYSLNANQIHVLKLMYKFRFVTSSLLASYKGISSVAANKTLKILLKEGFIQTRYDRSYKIRGKSASYSLAKRGLSYLRENAKLNQTMLHAMYKNSTVGDRFVDENLETMRTYLTLRDSYPGMFHIYTKSDAADYEYFPDPKPELYFSATQERAPDYFVYIFSEYVQPFIMKKRFKQVLEHFDEGDWEASTSSAYPILLYILPSPGMEAKIQVEIKKQLENAGIDDLQVYTTTSKALHYSTGETAIWTSVVETSSLVSL